MGSFCIVETGHIVILIRVDLRMILALLAHHEGKNCTVLEIQVLIALHLTHALNFGRFENRICVSWDSNHDLICLKTYLVMP
jgi:hypothetical protein